MWYTNETHEALMKVLEIQKNRIDALTDAKSCAEISIPRKEVIKHVWHESNYVSSGFYGDITHYKVTVKEAIELIIKYLDLQYVESKTEPSKLIKAQR
jgi:hypothetical protein